MIIDDGLGHRRTAAILGVQLVSANVLLKLLLHSRAGNSFVEYARADKLGRVLFHRVEWLGGFMIGKKPTIEFVILGRGDLLHRKANPCVFAGVNMVSARALDHGVAIRVEWHRDHHAGYLTFQFFD